MEVVWEMSSGIIKEKQTVLFLSRPRPLLPTTFRRQRRSLSCCASALHRQPLSRENRRKAVPYDLFTVLFKLSADWRPSSFGGGYAAMPLIQNQVVQLIPWLSQSEFTDLDHHFPDDPRPDRSQFRNLCRHPHCRSSRSAGSYHRLCAPFLHSCNDSGKNLLKIPKFKPSSGHFKIPPSCRDRHDRSCRVSILVTAFWETHFLPPSGCHSFQYKYKRAGNLSAFLDSSCKIQNDPVSM